MDSRNNPIDDNGSLYKEPRIEDDSALDLLRDLQHERSFAERAAETSSSAQSSPKAPEAQPSDDHIPFSLPGVCPAVNASSEDASADSRDAADTTMHTRPAPLDPEQEPVMQKTKPDASNEEKGEREEEVASVRPLWRGLLTFARRRGRKRCREEIASRTEETFETQQVEPESLLQNPEDQQSEVDNTDPIPDDSHEKKSPRRMSIWSVMGDGLSQISWIRNNVPLLLLVVALSGYNIYNEFSMKDKIRQVAVLEKKLNDYRSRALFKRADITSSEQLESIEKAVEAESLNLSPSEEPPFIIYVSSRNKNQE